MLRRLVMRLVVIALASCGGIVATTSSDDGGGSDATTACATDSDCKNGLACLYPAAGGCSATRQCLTPSKACKGITLCACDGTNVVDNCGPGASKPILKQGLCDDAGPFTCPSGLACEVCDLTGYTPPPMAKPMNGTQACTPSELAAFVTACAASTATSASCSMWQKENLDAGTCLGCLLTEQTAATWGPYVCTSASCLANSGGCIDVVLGEVSSEKASGGSGSCGDLYTSNAYCDDYACGTCTNADYNTCIDDATVNVCTAYETAVTSTNGPCAALDDVDSGAALCVPQSDADVAKFVNVFCGTGP